MIEYIKEDWLYRLPYRVQHNRYTGLSRPAYVFWCFVYYVIKDAVLLYFYLVFRFYKFILYDIWKMMFEKVPSDRGNGKDNDEIEESEVEDDEDTRENDAEEDAEEYTEEDHEEKVPFSQLFNVSKDMCLLIDHVEMCPDETAFIRVVDSEGYTPLYKRKVRRDKSGNRFIVFNGTNHYLDDSKTQPTSLKK